MIIEASKRLAANTFQDLTKERDRLDELGTKLTKEMNKIRDAAGGSGPMGLTPDAVRNDPKYKKLKREYDASFQQLRKINQFLTRNFKKELAEERKQRRGY